VPVVNAGELVGVVTMTDIIMAQPKLIQKFDKIIRKK
jgi:CBS domain-containing protein